jgi:hypothetical protein
MDKSDRIFKAACEKYYKDIIDLIKDGNMKQADKIVANIQSSLFQWEKQIKTARQRINMLRTLLIKISKNR